MQNRKQDRPWYFLIPKPPFVDFLLKAYKTGRVFERDHDEFSIPTGKVLFFANTIPFKFAVVYLVSISTVCIFCSMASLPAKTAEF